MPPPQEPFVPNRDLPGPRLEKGSSLLEATTSLAEGRRSVWLLAEPPCLLELPHGAKLCRQGSVPPTLCPQAHRLAGGPGGGFRFFLRH